MAQESVLLPGQWMDATYPRFNQTAISQRGISKVTLRVMRKPSSQTIYDDGKRMIYHFDRQGRLVLFQSVSRALYGGSDTIIRVNVYSGDRLKASQERIGHYQRSVNYSYPDEHTVIENISVKRGSLPWQPIAEEVVRHRIQLAGSDSVVVSERGGLGAEPYQRTISTYNDGILSQQEVWLGPRAQSIETWEMADGLISTYSFEHLPSKRKTTITYNADEGAQDSGTWCVDGECLEWSLVLHPDGLPKGWIMIDPTSQDLTIWEFRYDYY